MDTNGAEHPVERRVVGGVDTHKDLHVAAVVDWFSRRVLSWRGSTTLEAAVWVQGPEGAVARHGPAAIFKTDRSKFKGRSRAA